MDAPLCPGARLGGALQKRQKSGAHEILESTHFEGMDLRIMPASRRVPAPGGTLVRSDWVRTGQLKFLQTFFAKGLGCHLDERLDAPGSIAFVPRRVTGASASLRARMTPMNPAIFDATMIIQYHIQASGRR